VREKGWRSARTAWDSTFQDKANELFAKNELFEQTEQAAANAVAEVAAGADDHAPLPMSAEEEIDDDDDADIEDEPLTAAVGATVGRVMDIRVITSKRSEYRVEFSNFPGQCKWLSRLEVMEAGNWQFGGSVPGIATR
jgi:hypothetical protein